MHCIAIAFFLNLYYIIVSFHVVKYFCKTGGESIFNPGGEKALRDWLYKLEKKKNREVFQVKSPPPFCACIFLSQETSGIWVVITCEVRARRRSNWSLFGWWRPRDQWERNGLELGRMSSDPVEYELLGVTAWPGTVCQADVVISFSYLFAFPF